MNDLFAQVAGSGLHVDLVVALLSVVLIVVGATLLLTVLTTRMLARAQAGSADSRLLPTLAEEVLDDDLRAAYQRSMWLDTLIAQHFPELGDPTGTELGRQVRKWLVRLQAQRFAGAPTQQGEPAGQQTRLAEIDAVLDQALDLVDSAEPGEPADVAAGLAGLTEQLGPPRSRSAG